MGVTVAFPGLSSFRSLILCWGADRDDPMWTGARRAVSHGLELLRWDKAVLTASERCALPHSRSGEAEWLTNLYCSPPSTSYFLLLALGISPGGCSENVGLREVGGQLASGNRVMYSCAATVSPAKQQSAIHTYDRFLWVRSQGTACPVLCLRYHRLQSSCPLRLGFPSEGGVGWGGRICFLAHACGSQ